ncbi:MAG: hypothetical protein WA629_02535 [Candidatus Aquilonibacter sp.]
MRTPLVVLCSTILAVAGFSARAQAAVTPTFSFTAVRAPHPLALDPSLADPAWQAGKVPGDTPWKDVTTRGNAPDVTTAYFLYDDKNLYVAFVAPQKAPIVATQTTNDVGFGTDDFVSVGVDTSGAGSQAYLFETTPRGVRYQQATENVRYRPDWKAAATVQGSEWRAVMIIPLSSMRLHGGSNVWRIGFFRGVAATAEHYTWAFDGLMPDAGAGNWPSFNDLRYWPSVHVALAKSDSARPKPRLEVYALSSSGADRSYYQQADGTFFPQPTRYYGADASIPVTSTINLVGTLNPDFSNVEIDQQTIAPQEFERQLIEYRPFFAQGAQYLDPNPNGYSNFISYPNEVFYSPSIGPFDSGAKIEGVYGLQSFGLLTFHGYNAETGETFDDQAFGWKHALQDQTFQYWADGVLAHHSINGDDDTVEAGFKGRNLHTKFVYGFDYAIEHGTWVPQGTAHSANGYVDVHQNNYEVNLGYVDISPNYNPIDGYTENSDIRGLQGYVAFNGTLPGVKSWNVLALGDRYRDQSGAIHEADTGAYLSATFRNLFSLDGLGPTVSLLRQYSIPYTPASCTLTNQNPVVGTSSFTGFPCYLQGTAVPYNLMSLPIGYRDGSPTPIDVSANWGSFGGNWVHYYTSSTSRPIGSKLTLGLEYDGTFERNLVTGVLESQWLRRVSVGYNINAGTNISIGLRGINGLGGFVTEPGNNLAFGFHTRTNNGDIYVNYGSPAANYTLNRLIVKYVFRVGSAAGT